MEFSSHPSEQLSRLYHEKPFQGQLPEAARIIFISSDANYSPEISEHVFFNRILEYHADGVEFWKRHAVHHPFLLDTFPFDKTQHGRPFHARFRKLNLDSSYAPHISFLELLDIPTIGNKSSDRASFYNLVSVRHLKYLDNLITGGGHRLIFVSRGVLNDMYKMRLKHNVFQWLEKQTASKKYSFDIGDNQVREIYHFSSSHIFRQIDEIRKAIDDWLIQ
jgi:hypothetical protein